MWLLWVCVFVLCIGIFTFFSLPKGRWQVTGTVVFLILASITYFGAFELLGMSKPCLYEFRDLNGTRIIGVHLVEDEAVYVWLDIEGDPLVCYFPWDLDEAEDTQKKWSDKKNYGGELFLNLQDGMIASGLPPVSLPPKSE